MRILLITLILTNCFSLFAQRVQDEANHSEPRIWLEPFASGFATPADIQNAGDGRLFIVEQEGFIKIIFNNNTLPTPFLDLSTQVTFSAEQGLLGLAFHPNYNDNGYFFLNYVNNEGNTQISRFTVSDNADIADAASEFEILTIEQPFSNNNGGHIAFGTDGYLWIGSGDGGSEGDPENNAQNLNSFLGKMLRVDVDNTANGNNYAIPADNPYINNTDALDEIWAYGLKNPRKFSFSNSVEEFWIADGGQNNKIEFNNVSENTSGTNYGWRCYENYEPFDTDGCPAEEQTTLPFIEYYQPSSNCSKIGGIVYSANENEFAYNSFFFADNCAGIIGSVLSPFDFFIEEGFTENFTTFGEDFDKNLYIASSDGTIQKITIVWLSTDEYNKLDFKMTPNPADDNLQITMENNSLASITIYDLKGALVYSEKDKNVLGGSIDISGLESGLYLLKATATDGNSSSKKLIIK